MSHPSPFQFASAPAAPAGAFVARIPAGLVAADELIVTLAERLLFPSYFGFNWNALADCLRDFHWLAERSVVIIHDDLPALPPAELRIYLDILAESITSWTPGEAHTLTVFFPASAELEVERLELETEAMEDD